MRVCVHSRFLSTFYLPLPSWVAPFSMPSSWRAAAPACRLLIRSTAAERTNLRTTLRARRTLCTAPPPQPPPAHGAGRGARDTTTPYWCVTYPPAAAAHEKPFWADAVGVVGFGLIGLQWLMSDMLTLRTFAIASSASMILYNMRAVAKPL